MNFDSPNSSENSPHSAQIPLCFFQLPLIAFCGQATFPTLQNIHSTRIKTPGRIYIKSFAFRSGGSQREYDRVRRNWISKAAACVFMVGRFSLSIISTPAAVVSVCGERRRRMCQRRVHRNVISRSSHRSRTTLLAMRPHLICPTIPAGGAATAKRGQNRLVHYK